MYPTIVKCQERKSKEFHCDLPKIVFSLYLYFHIPFSPDVAKQWKCQVRFATKPSDFRGNLPNRGNDPATVMHGNAPEREREREWEGARGGRERTFKYEQKRARYLSPTLTVQTDSYPNHEESYLPPSASSSYASGFPRKSTLEKKGGHGRSQEERERRTGGTRGSRLSSQKARISSGRIESRAGSGGRSRGRKCVWLCASVNWQKAGKRGNGNR